MRASLPEMPTSLVAASLRSSPLRGRYKITKPAYEACQHTAD
jgi:hypothetical protein